MFITTMIFDYLDINQDWPVQVLFIYIASKFMHACSVLCLVGWIEVFLHINLCGKVYYMVINSILLFVYCSWRKMSKYICEQQVRLLRPWETDWCFILLFACAEHLLRLLEWLDNRARPSHIHCWLLTLFPLPLHCQQCPPWKSLLPCLPSQMG